MIAVKLRSGGGFDRPASAGYGPRLVVMSWRRTYTGYSIGCALTWAVILTLVAVVYPDRLRTYLLVGAGWWIGWTSATVARSVYPPPKRVHPAT